MSISRNHLQGGSSSGDAFRLSSNNPYRDLEAQQQHPNLPNNAPPTEQPTTFPSRPTNAFMTFAVRERPKPDVSIIRRNTIATNPVPIEEFDAIFDEQQQQPLYRRPSRAESIASLAAHSQYDSNEEQDYSDTARLTSNMAGDGPSPPPTQPRRNQSLRKVATVLRRVSRRVVNNNTMATIDEQPMIQESIPMTSTSKDPSSTSSTPPATTQIMPLVQRQRKHKGIILSGKSLGIFGPENPLRRMFAKMLQWR